MMAEQAARPLGHPVLARRRAGPAQHISLPAAAEGQLISPRHAANAACCWAAP